jgi:sulfide:quinone oxidoreductase
VVQLRYITPTFAVAGELQSEDFAELARLGFKGVISNRPDGEEWGQLTAADSAALAATAGLAFRHVPAVKHDIFSPAVGAAMQAAMTDVGEPAVAHCKSGLRSALLWALVRAGDTPVDQIVAAVREAGYDLSGLADEIAAAGQRRG